MGGSGLYCYDPVASVFAEPVNSIGLLRALGLALVANLVALFEDSVEYLKTRTFDGRMCKTVDCRPL